MVKKSSTVAKYNHLEQTEQKSGTCFSLYNIPVGPDVCQQQQLTVEDTGVGGAPTVVSNKKETIEIDVYPLALNQISQTREQH